MKNILILIFACTFLLPNLTFSQIESEHVDEVLPSILELTQDKLLSNLGFSKLNFSVSLNQSEKTSIASMAFFCRMERKMSNSARIPIRLRLGDIDYTNFMEGRNTFNDSPFRQ